MDQSKLRYTNHAQGLEWQQTCNHKINSIKYVNEKYDTQKIQVIGSL